MLNQWAEIVLRNLGWTTGWVVAAVLLFLLIVAVIGGGRQFTAEAQRTQRKAGGKVKSPHPAGGLSQGERVLRAASANCNASECPRCRRRDEAAKVRRMRQLEKFLEDTAPAEPRRSLRVGPPNPGAGGLATGQRVDAVA